MLDPVLVDEPLELGTYGAAAATWQFLQVRAGTWKFLAVPGATCCNREPR